MQLTVTDLSYCYDDAPALALGPLTATFPEGWTGIVGSNGCGKSTLLRVATGDLTGYHGSISPRPAYAAQPTQAIGAPLPAPPAQPSGAPRTAHLPHLSNPASAHTAPPPHPLPPAPSYCAQATEQLPALADEFALDFAGEAMRIRRVLGVEDDWVWRFDTLSHGERKRLQVAVALWLNPPVLALDEPTNHVDAATREQLLAALEQYRGVGLLVSHDRELLDALVGQCLFMRDGVGNMRRGSYSQGGAQEALEHQRVAGERKSAKQEMARLQSEQDRRIHEAARADSRRSKKGIDLHDHDAKAKIDLARVSGQDGKAGRRSAQLDARVQAMEKRVAQAFVPKVYDGSFWLETQPSKRRVLVTLEEGSLPLGSGRTLSFPKLDVENTAHIGLTGPNGAGKSTLIRHLVGQLLATAATADIPGDVRGGISKDIPAATTAATHIPVLYLPQELDSLQARQLLAELKALDAARRGQTLSLVARLNSDPDRILSGQSLSPGELRKIMLARGVLQNPQLIIMDEPTNHLDLPSTEALEDVLASCPCALVLVSHDAAFLRATTTTLWRFTPESVGGAVSVEQW